MSDEGPLAAGCQQINLKSVVADSQQSTKQIFADMQAAANDLPAAKAPAKGAIAQAIAEAAQSMPQPTGVESSLAKGGAISHVNTVKSLVKFGADVVTATQGGVVGAAAGAISDALKTADPTAQSLDKLQKVLAANGITNIGKNKTPVGQAIGQLWENKTTIDSCNYFLDNKIPVYARPGDTNGTPKSTAAFVRNCAARHQNKALGDELEFTKKPLAMNADEAALKASVNQVRDNSTTSGQRQQFNADAKAAEMKMTSEIADAARKGDVNALKNPVPRMAARLTPTAAATVFNFSNQVATNFNRAASQNDPLGQTPPEEKIAPVSVAAAPVTAVPTRRLGMSMEMANKLNLLPSLTPKPATPYIRGQYALDA